MSEPDLRVPCPKCGAKRGKPCIRAKGLDMGIAHRERYRARNALERAESAQRALAAAQANRPSAAVLGAVHAMRAWDVQEHEALRGWLRQNGQIFLLPISRTTSADAGDPVSFYS